jgi:hypothetical protein
MEVVTWLPLLRFEEASFVHVCCEPICLPSTSAHTNSLRSEHAIYDVYRQQGLHAES